MNFFAQAQVVINVKARAAEGAFMSLMSGGFNSVDYSHLLGENYRIMYSPGLNLSLPRATE